MSQTASETMLLTVFLRHDQSNNLDAVQTKLKDAEWWDRFPPAGVEIVSWTVAMGFGQIVTLRFSGLDRPTTPEINGTLTLISPDTTVDPKTGQTYYTVRVALDPREIARLGSIKLVPGMPVEMFVKTGDRNVLSFLLKPLNDQIARTFREE